MQRAIGTPGRRWAQRRRSGDSLAGDFIAFGMNFGSVVNIPVSFAEGGGRRPIFDKASPHPPVWPFTSTQIINSVKKAIVQTTFS